MWLALPEALLPLGVGAFVGAAVAGAMGALLWNRQSLPWDDR